MKQIVMVVVMCVCFCPSTWAEQEETVSSLSKEIAAKETEKRKIDKENPCVLYMEEDNTGMNIKKTMDRCKGKYPKGVTYVNRTFFCPIHKVSTPCIKSAYGPLEWCKKAQLARVQWSNLVKKIPKTEEWLMLSAIRENIFSLRSTKSAPSLNLYIGRTFKPFIREATFLFLKTSALAAKRISPLFATDSTRASMSVLQ